MPRPRGAARTDYDIVEFPHTLIASQLDAAQEEGYGYGYEHAMASACERLREDGRLPAATAALHRLAEHHPACSPTPSATCSASTATSPAPSSRACASATPSTPRSTPP